MLRVFKLSILLVLLTAFFSGCQAFFEDYNYGPGGVSTGATSAAQGFSGGGLGIGGSGY